MAEEDETAAEAYGATTAIGAGLAEVAGVGGPVGVAVAGAAAVGVGIGMGIEYLTDGAVSDTLSDGLLGLVGEEESYKAAQSFDDGDYLEGVGHMLSGAGETIGEAASDAAEWVGDTASDAYDAVADTAGDVVDFLNPFD
jgi:hypothetical protein